MGKTKKLITKKDLQNSVTFRLVPRERYDPKLGLVRERVFEFNPDQEVPKNLEKVIEELDGVVVRDTSLEREIMKELGLPEGTEIIDVEEVLEEPSDEKVEDLFNELEEEGEEDELEDEFLEKLNLESDKKKQKFEKLDLSDMFTKKEDLKKPEMIEEYDEGEYDEGEYEEGEYEEGEYEEGEYEEGEDGDFDTLAEIAKQMVKEKIDTKSTVKDEQFNYQQQLELQFAKALEQYTDDKIGELDDDEVRGEVDVNTLESIHEEAEELIKEPQSSYFNWDEHIQKLKNEAEKQDEENIPRQKKITQEVLNKLFPGYVEAKKKKIIRKEEIIEKTRELIRRMGEEEEVDPEDGPVPEYFIEKPREQWDCESIITTYSNLENHPTLITDVPTTAKRAKIQLSQKTGMPIGVLPNSKEKLKKEIRENLGKSRDKNETKESKKERKKQVKMEKRMKRLEKKMLKKAFKEEEVKQQHIIAKPENRQRIVVKY